MKPDYHITIIGAGVIGLALANALAHPKRKLLILDQADHWGQGISARSSEVIHAGIYYPSTSLKAQLCIQGRHQLLDYCHRFGVAHRITGKLLVATSPDQCASLHHIQQQACALGVDIAPRSQRQIRAQYPYLCAQEGLWSGGSGIIDSQQLMRSLLVNAQQTGPVDWVGRSKVHKVQARRGHWQLLVGDEGFALTSQIVINAAGLGAQSLALTLEQLEPRTIPPLYLCQGRYYRYHGRHPFTTLVYPLPGAAGLGIHATVDLHGGLRFGPDAHYIDTEQYQLPETPACEFVQAIKHYWPGLDATRLHPDYAGIRPKLGQAHQGFQDFSIQTPEDHGLPGLVQLFGIESPGLTASLALADYVANQLADTMHFFS